MSVDLSQFHQVFIEESVEGLDAMESTLMELDPSNIDNEMINTIFRSAHSIKGGSATFGFKAIAEFTHVLETLLDQIRDGSRPMSPSDVNLFLESVDCMRDLLASIDNGVSHFTEDALTLKNKFEKILEFGSVVETSSAEEHHCVDVDETPAHEQVEGTVAWAIKFEPGCDILKTGNDPSRIFQALSDMGNFSVELAEHTLPDFADFDPEHLYLSWSLVLEVEGGKAAIEEQFEWVQDESVIVIEKAPSHSGGWRIDFCPKPSLLKTGNEPSKLIDALADLGELGSVQCNVSAVPSLKKLDPENCFLSWGIELYGDIKLEDIEEVFEWVDDEATISIHAIGAVNEESAVPTATESEQAPEATPTLSVIENTAFTEDNEPEETASQKPKTVAKKQASTESTSIRVGIDKVDTLINMVGELVITQSMLGQLGTDFDPSQTPKLIEGLSQLEQNTRELQESVMRIRMLPISFAFSRFPRMVRDLGQQLDKKINLIMLGEQTELDKTVMEKIGDPLVHLVRNSVDHGIETPEERRAVGKDETGTITLNAYHLSGNVVIEIQDDGKGLDRERIVEKAIDKGLLTQSDSKVFSDEQIFDLIFQPGFSTADVVSDVSGRGVGMDVVRRNIQALNGVVEIRSQKDKGSTILIRLPLTLAILDGQLVSVGGEVFVFPLVSIVESIQCKQDMVSHIAGGCQVFKLRDEYIPIVRLDDTYDCKGRDSEKSIDNALMVVVECDREKFGIVVDELLAQQQVVIKSLEQNYKRIEGVSGATILGDGKVALIIDIPGVVKLAGIKDMKRLISDSMIHAKLAEQNSQKLQA